MDIFKKVLEFKHAKKELEAAKQKELKLRKELARLILGVKDFDHSEKREVFFKNVSVKAEVTESLEIIDKEEMLSMYFNDRLNDDELKALKIKPDITLSRAQKLDEDSILWQCMGVKVSPTPVITIKEQEDAL